MFIYLDPIETPANPEVRNLIYEIEKMEVLLRMKFTMDERWRTLPWLAEFTDEKQAIFSDLQYREISLEEAKEKCLHLLHDYYRERQNN